MDMKQAVKRVTLAALIAALGLTLIWMTWTKAAALLNARSDTSVLLGCLLVSGLLAFIGLSVYLVLTRLSAGVAARQSQMFAPSDAPKSLFAERINPVEQQHESDKLKHER